MFVSGTETFLKFLTGKVAARAIKPLLNLALFMVGNGCIKNWKVINSHR